MTNDKLSNILVSDGFDINELDEDSLIDNNITTTQKKRQTKRNKILDEENQELIESGKDIQGIHYSVKGIQKHLKANCLLVRSFPEIFELEYVYNGPIDIFNSYVHDLLLFEENNVIIGNFGIGKEDSDSFFLFKKNPNKEEEKYLNLENINTDYAIKALTVDMLDENNIKLKIQICK